MTSLPPIVVPDDYATLAAAIAAAKPGQTVLIRRGTYPTVAK